MLLMLAAPVGNEPGAKFPALSCSPNGAGLVSAWVNSIMRGNTSKIPKDPRIAVLPLWNGSQEKPTRGSKLCNVGFLKKGEPKLPGKGEVNNGRLAIWL